MKTYKKFNLIAFIIINFASSLCYANPSMLSGAQVKKHEIKIRVHNDVALKAITASPIDCHTQEDVKEFNTPIPAADNTSEGFLFIKDWNNIFSIANAAADVYCSGTLSPETGGVDKYSFEISYDVGKDVVGEPTGTCKIKSINGPVTISKETGFDDNVYHCTLTINEADYT